MYVAGSQHVCPQIITWENSSYTVEKSGSTFFGKAKLISPVRVKLCVLADVILKKDITTLMFSSSQRCISKSHEKTLDKYKFRHILPNNWPVFFKNVNVLKEKTEEFFQIKRD